MTQRVPAPHEPSPPPRGRPIDQQLRHASTLFDDNDADTLKTHTDLPFAQSANGGSPSRPLASAQPSAAELLEALDRLLFVPGGPPLHNLDHRAVVAWVEAASMGLAFRRERRMLMRRVLRVLDEEWHTADSIARDRQQVLKVEQDRRDRADGTYWTKRESGRAARQPVHVEVDPEAWERAKAKSRRESTGVGEYVGKLVTAEVGRLSESANTATEDGSDRPRRRAFARLGVDKSTWREFVIHSQDAGVTVARHVGLIVERTNSIADAGRL